MATSYPNRPGRPGWGRRVHMPHLLAGVVGAIILVQLVVLGMPDPDERLASLGQFGTPTRPTRTPTAPRPTVTMTPSPSPTFEPTAEVTDTPPATRRPQATPDATGTVEPRETPVATRTPAPIATRAATTSVAATRTPVPPLRTAEPTTTELPTPSATPEPVEVLERISVSNGELGTGWIQVRYEPDDLGAERVSVRGGDGTLYHAQVGFLSSEEAQAAIQQHWEYGGRGGGNWSMIVLVGQPAAAGACPDGALVCYESSTNSGQAVLTSRVIIQRDVWRWLLDDYLNGGVEETTQNGHYASIQRAVFEPVSRIVPDVPCLGFTFTRAE